MDEWTWIPNTVEVNETPKVTVVAYGDGYEARLQLGINANLPTYTVSYTDADTEMLARMRAFLVGKGALERFLFLTPDGVWVPVVAGSWVTQYGAGVGALTIDLRQVAEL